VHIECNFLGNSTTGTFERGFGIPISLNGNCSSAERVIPRDRAQAAIHFSCEGRDL
jgi:hypothetical protein